MDRVLSKTAPRVTWPAPRRLIPYQVEPLIYRNFVAIPDINLGAIGRGAAAVTMEQIEGLQQRAVFVPFGLSRR
jgi:hypothetical protein